MDHRNWRIVPVCAYWTWVMAFSGCSNFPLIKKQTFEDSIHWFNLCLSSLSSSALSSSTLSSSLSSFSSSSCCHRRRRCHHRCRHCHRRRVDIVVVIVIVVVLSSSSSFWSSSPPLTYEWSLFVHSFRLLNRLCFAANLSASLCYVYISFQVIDIERRSNYRDKHFALGLALKTKLSGTRKCYIGPHCRLERAYSRRLNLLIIMFFF